MQEMALSYEAASHKGYGASIVLEKFDTSEIGMFNWLTTNSIEIWSLLYPTTSRNSTWVNNSRLMEHAIYFTINVGN